MASIEMGPRQSGAVIPAGARQKKDEYQRFFCVLENMGAAEKKPPQKKP